MIEHPNVVLVGRFERAPLDFAGAWIRDAAGRFESIAQRAWFHRYPDDRDEWDDWNVIAMIGKFGAWHAVEFMGFEGFGTTPVPVLRSRLQFVPATRHIDPMPVTGYDPPVLHKSSRLMPADGKLPGDKWTPASRKTWMVGCRTVEDYLERRGLYGFPTAGTQRGWERLLVREGLRINNSGHRPNIESINFDVQPELAEAM